ncbi:MULTISPECIES: AAA family ATPase [Nonomuraea]|uniref:AAA family ATPase n=2 Tax=Nonomuraea TaxID=83681 RepID=A0ABW1BL19_9ACTN|nr:MULTISPECIES: AAA family ATPase [Nonomuraea]TXK34509.1 ATP-binding protein [Nonomuraea sp. C10]
MTAPVPSARKAAEPLCYPAGSLVIITGLPGAGKSTLLGRLYPLTGAESSPVRAGGATVVDSMQSRLRWAAALAWAPKPVRTAVVFVTHIRRIRAALGRGESVVAHNRGCGPLVLRGFARLARRAGAGFHLVILDVPAGAAMAGQRARGRVVPWRTFARHRRHCAALLARVRAGDPAPAATARVLDRETAARLAGIRFE